MTVCLRQKGRFFISMASNAALNLVNKAFWVIIWIIQVFFVHCIHITILLLNFRKTPFLADEKVFPQKSCSI